MSFMWLVAWLINRRPRVQMFRGWNNWGISLGICLAIDLMSSMGRTARGMRRRSAEPAPAWHPAENPEKVTAGV